LLRIPYKVLLDRIPRLFLLDTSSFDINDDRIRFVSPEKVKKTAQYNMRLKKNDGFSFAESTSGVATRSTVHSDEFASIKAE
jgi:hypothetical protein